MAYTTAEGRQQLLDTVAESIDRLAQALALLGVAYEELDESRADQLEELLFRPVQGAYGRLRRTHVDFAARVGLASRPFGQPQPPAAWHGSRSLVEEAADEVAAADDTLADLQDSLLPVEVGDPELRTALAGVREQLTPLQDGADELLRQLWR